VAVCLMLASPTAAFTANVGVPARRRRPAPV